MVLLAEKLYLSPSLRVTRTLTNRHPLVSLNRVAIHLRLEKHLATFRKDKEYWRDCDVALRTIHGLKVRLGRSCGAEYHEV
jgi:hypothetical protein